MRGLSHWYPVGSCNRWLRKSWNSSTGLELGKWRKVSLGPIWIWRFFPYQNLRNVHDLLYFRKCCWGRLSRKSKRIMDIQNWMALTLYRWCMLFSILYSMLSLSVAKHEKIVFSSTFKEAREVSSSLRPTGTEATLWSWLDGWTGTECKKCNGKHMCNMILQLLTVGYSTQHIADLTESYLYDWLFWYVSGHVCVCVSFDIILKNHDYFQKFILLLTEACALSSLVGPGPFTATLEACSPRDCPETSRP